ncbi:MAG: hypothetical protein Q4C12_07215 [Clostridia bacterium]|nr:hypothetical protein [Clostridia bacterium]
MKQFFKILPHIQIILALMLLTFAIIDKFNSAMAFIDNEITKNMLIAFSVCAITTAILLVHEQRRSK